MLKLNRVVFQRIWRHAHVIVVFLRLLGNYFAAGVGGVHYAVAGNLMTDLWKI